MYKWVACSRTVSMVAYQLRLVDVRLNDNLVCTHLTWVGEVMTQGVGSGGFQHNSVSTSGIDNASLSLGCKHTVSVATNLRLKHQCERSTVNIAWPAWCGR